MALCLTACGVQITTLSLPESVELQKGESQTLAVEYGAEKEASADALTKAAEKLGLVWASGDESVATVDEAGTVTAVAPGDAEITVSTGDGKLQASCTVTVTVALTGVDAPESLELDGEETKELGVSILPADATGVTLSYESSDEAVATVDADGLVTAVAPGECVIKIKAAGIGSPAAETQTKITVKAPAVLPTTGVSGGNGGSTGTASGGTNTQTQPSGSGTAPTQPSNPDPAPQPSNPDPVPQPPAGGALGGGNDGPIPGGGTWEGDGGNAVIGGRPESPVE